MKKIVFPILLVVLTTALFAQPTLDLGLKAGINVSKLSFDKSDYNSESILKTHFGAFGRVGLGKLFIQPELYFSKKGGELDPNPVVLATSFDFSNVDVPILLGVKLIDVKAFELHALAGPVFSFITDSDVEGDPEFDVDYFKDKYVGIQYGLGADVLFLTINARMEHGANVYDHTINGNNSTFLVSVGFKIF